MINNIKNNKLLNSILPGPKDSLLDYMQKQRPNDVVDFQEHRKKLTPVLEQLKKTVREKADSSLDKAFKSNYLTTNIVNTFKKPCSIENQFNLGYYLEPAFRGNSNETKYRAALNNLVSESGETHYAVHLSSTGDALNAGNFKKQLDSSVNLKLEDCPGLNDAVGYFAEKISTLPEAQINTLNVISTNYEQAAFVTLEIYLVAILGQALFMSLFIPFHNKGDFTYFVKQSIAKHYQQKFEKLPFFEKLLFNNKYIKYFKRYGYTGVVLTAIHLSRVVLLGLINSDNVSTNSSHVLTEKKDAGVMESIVSSLFRGNIGLSYKPLTDVRCFMNSVLYEVGFTISSFSESFIRGISAKYEGPLRIAATKIDNYGNEKSSRK